MSGQFSDYETEAFSPRIVKAIFATGKGGGHATKASPPLKSTSEARAVAGGSNLRTIQRSS
ncbi:hypothetical protein [Armatimonas sp.]|uniref:hypothetical protein n=1 Tax=Armatimonas sp. TaxID=1872638 RepID=UPI003751CF01